jgi:hypothetical protein
MSTYRLENAVVNVTCQSAQPLGAADALVVAFYRDLKQWRANVVVASMKFHLVDGVYKLTNTHSDGRKWKQDIMLGEPPDPDPTMTFNVGDQWRLSEFATFRVVRDHLIALVIKYGLTDCDVDFV